MLEVLLAKQGAQEADIGRHPGDDELVESALRPRDRDVEARAAARHLHEHGVEVRGDLPAEHRRPVEAHARPARRAVRGDRSGVGPKAVGRVLGGDAALQRRAAGADLLLADVLRLKARAGGDAHLRLDDIDLGDLLGDGVLHLHAGVHLDEDVAALLVDEELDGARAPVADVLAEAHRVLADPLAQLLAQVLRGGDLDDLLVAALQRTVPLVEVDDIAVVVAEDLHLDVLRVDHRALEVDLARAERRGRLAGGLRGLLTEVLGALDEAHAAPAAAGDGLDEDGELAAFGHAHDLVDVLRGLRVVEDRQARLPRRGDGGGLVAGEVEDLRRGADEGDPVVRALPGELRVLGEEPVAGVDGVRARLLRRADHLVDGEVRLDRGARLHHDGLVRERAVEGVAVLPREDRDGLRADLVGGAERAHGDLPAVGDEDLLERGKFSVSHDKGRPFSIAARRRRPGA